MNQLMEGMLPRGQMDLVQEISYQLPTLVLAEFLDIPMEDRASLQEWTRLIFQLSSPTVGTDMVALVRQANDCMRQFDQYLRKLLKQHHRRPSGPMPSSQMIQNEEAFRMTDDELVAQISLLLSAGHLTVTGSRSATASTSCSTTPTSSSCCGSTPST